MGISRMMSQQVRQSEEAMQTLGKAGPGGGSVSPEPWLQNPSPSTCPGFLHLLPYPCDSPHAYSREWLLTLTLVSP